jgi:hypothetical protein
MQMVVVQENYVMLIIIFVQIVHTVRDDDRWLKEVAVAVYSKSSCFKMTVSNTGNFKIIVTFYRNLTTLCVGMTWPNGEGRTASLG